MTAGSHDGFPAVLGEMQATTEHLVDIANLEGDVLELGALVTCGQQSHIMVIAFRGTATEQTRLGIAVRGRELETIQLEILTLRQVVRTLHFEYDVANARWFGARIVNSRFIDSFAAAHKIDLGRSGINIVGRLHGSVLPQLETYSISEWIETMDRTVGSALHSTIACELFGHNVEVRLRRNTPHDFTNA